MARGCSIPTLVKAFTKYVQLSQRCPVSIKALFCIKIESNRAIQLNDNSTSQFMHSNWIVPIRFSVAKTRIDYTVGTRIESCHDSRLSPNNSSTPSHVLSSQWTWVYWWPNPGLQSLRRCDERENLLWPFCPLHQTTKIVPWKLAIMFDGYRHTKYRAAEINGWLSKLR